MTATSVTIDIAAKKIHRGTKNTAATTFPLAWTQALGSMAAPNISREAEGENLIRKPCD
jgi:hypothetical protein